MAADCIAMGNASNPVRDKIVHALRDEYDSSAGDVDKDYLTKKLIEENHGWSKHFAERCVYEYLKFMYLILKYGNASPSYCVDQVWHLHILDTKDYAAFCSQAMHRFISHSPNKKRSEGENTSHIDTFKLTLKGIGWSLENLQQIYGEKLPLIRE